MIVVNLMGGLGNQMFQYALGRHLSLLHQTELLLDCTFLNTNKDLHIKRGYELDVFKIAGRLADEKELKKFKLLQSSSILRRVHQFAPALFSNHLISEKTHAFDSDVLLSRDNSWLNGFWQTEKYFIDVEKTIRADFEFKSLVQGQNKKVAEEITACNSISIHVRRGDYTSPETLAFHGMCSPEYYYNAIELLSQQIQIDKLFVFSDDSAWVKKHLSFRFPALYIDHNQGKNSFEDMRLMSLCKHHVIANSSFSWWAAWLNKHTTKIVIAPKHWIANKNINTQDVIPTNWIKL